MAKLTEQEKALNRARPRRNTRHSPQPCKRCGALIIQGLSDRVCAWTVHLDPTPITEAGETAALLIHHKSTYSLDHGEITPRHHHKLGIENSPPKTGAILADHKCDRPIPPEWVDHSIKKAKRQLPDKPEF